MAEGKRCHGGETEMVLRHHPSSGNTIEMLVQRNKCGCTKRARVTGSDPGYQVSQVSVAWQTRDVHETDGHGANTGFISYITQHSSTGHRLGGIPSKRAFSESVEFIVEVDVLAMYWK